MPQNTMHCITAFKEETCGHERDYHETQIFALKSQHFDDIIFVDCFFSFICSIQNYKCFQMHTLKIVNYRLPKIGKRIEYTGNIHH